MDTRTKEQAAFEAAMTDVNAAFTLLTGLKGNRELPDLFSEQKLPADVFGQLLMQHIGPDTMSFDEKLFWMEVAEYIGPDYIQAFRKVAAFMAKTQEF